MFDPFLRCVSAAYCAAFLSVGLPASHALCMSLTLAGQAFFQIEGLFGEDGLQPVSALLRNWKSQLGPHTTEFGLFSQLPTLVWFHEPMGLLPETVMVPFDCSDGIS